MRKVLNQKRLLMMPRGIYFALSKLRNGNEAIIQTQMRILNRMGHITPMFCLILPHLGAIQIFPLISRRNLFTLRPVLELSCGSGQCHCPTSIPNFCLALTLASTEVETSTIVQVRSLHNQNAATTGSIYTFRSGVRRSCDHPNGRRSSGSSSSSSCQQRKRRRCLSAAGQREHCRLLPRRLSGADRASRTCGYDEDVRQPPATVNRGPSHVW